MDYGKLIKRAWQITWKHKVLWIYGALVALLGGAGWGRGGTGLRYAFSGADWDRLQRMWPSPMRPGNWHNWRALPSLDLSGLTGIALSGLVLLGLVGLVLAFASLLVRYSSIGAMIGYTDEVEEGRSLRFGGGMRRGWSRVLHLIGIDILLVLATLVAMLIVLIVLAVGAAVVAGPLLLIGSDAGAATVLAILWAVVSGLALVFLYIAALTAVTGLVSIVREHAFRASVLDLGGVRASIRAGCALVKRRFRASLGTWLVLAGIGLALSLVAVPTSMLGLGSLMLPALAVRGVTDSGGAALAVAIPFALLAIATAVLLGGVYIVFQSVVWTLAYRELTAPAELLDPA